MNMLDSESNSSVSSPATGWQHCVAFFITTTTLFSLFLFSLATHFSLTMTLDLSTQCLDGQW